MDLLGNEDACIGRQQGLGSISRQLEIGSIRTWQEASAAYDETSQGEYNISAMRVTLN